MPMNRRLIVVALSLAFATSLHAALTADNLLLVVNKNAPDGQKLAEYYAQQRHVPAGRIVSLDLPTGDDIGADDFDEKIVAPIREYLTSNHLKEQVTCIVNFYGVPLRIPARQNTPELRDEIVAIRRQSAATAKIAEPMVASLEQAAAQIDPSFKPVQVPAAQRADPLEILPRRAEAAVAVCTSKIQLLPADEKRASLEAMVRSIAAEFRAPVKLAEPSSAPTTEPNLSPQQITERMTELSAHRGDPNSRKLLRDFTREHGGILLFMQILSAQEQYLTIDESEASVDDELPTLWWGIYPRTKWLANPLNYKYFDASKQTVMVMRLDASTPAEVRGIIDSSIKAENEGLSGKVVIDSRGIAPVARSGKPDGYGIYDQSIRDLATLIKDHTKLDMLFDEQPMLLPPNSAKDVMLYCGWYSPGKYVPCVALKPGALAAHIASFEMTTLHNPTTGWCKNLIDGGAAATFGPVAEPYLHSFPLANEFFGLVLTGKITLAEAFWATNPLVSWKMAMVGDPLYVPFKVNPALRPEDLPPQMKSIFERDR
jgi:uncharacterized protein (TIGR03790 family)